MKRTVIAFLMLSSAAVAQTNSKATNSTVPNEDQIRKALPHVVGKKLYYVVVGKEDLLQPQKTLDRPKLVPLEILSAELVSKNVVYTFRLPNDDEDVQTVPLGCFDGVDVTNESKLLKAVACGEFLTAMPNLTAREIAAVKKGVMFRGMSRRALNYAPMTLNRQQVSVVLVKKLSHRKRNALVGFAAGTGVGLGIGIAARSKPGQFQIVSNGAVLGSWSEMPTRLLLVNFAPAASRDDDAHNGPYDCPCHRTPPDEACHSFEAA